MIHHCHTSPSRALLSRSALHLHRAVLALVVSFVLSVNAIGGDPQETTWTRFRGENGMGAIATCNVPIPWSEADVCWTIDLPGKGNSSPIVAGERVFLLSADPNSAERYVLCYDLKSGQELWRETYASEPHTLHARSSYASSTPCANEHAVFVAWAKPDSLMLAAFNHAGEEIWQRDLGRYISQHGFGASPVLFGETLVLLNSQQAQELPPGVEPGLSRAMAFNSVSGELLWESPRTATRACYGVPTLFKDEAGNDALLFTNTGDGFFALDLATGKQLWNKSVFTKRTVSSPIIVGDMAIGTEGSGGGGNILFAVQLQGKHELVFQVNRAAPYVPTPVSKGNLLFTWSDNGIVSCIKLPEAEVVWSKRVGGNVSTSPLIAGDKLIGIAEDGTLTAIAATEEFSELGSIKLEDTVRATPLLSRDYILIRSDSKLLCVGKP